LDRIQHTEVWLSRWAINDRTVIQFGTNQRPIQMK